MSQGVEKYSPEINKPITEVDGCKAVDTILTNDNEIVNQIHSVVKEGLKLQITNTEMKIISEAEVIVYKKEESDE